ncbi:hypothetical protein ElyMa_005381900 [Elysia marginata]|uniref:Uncharacterized protein n=1 Tax=Elysia marginata TaxID=1093978 RepID=A0AAV4EEN8_9GAST|nr:hypothetical protein ElyMa_005381900 [Elysia marginata]
MASGFVCTPEVKIGFEQNNFHIPDLRRLTKNSSLNAGSSSSSSPPPSPPPSSSPPPPLPPPPPSSSPLLIYC